MCRYCGIGLASIVVILLIRHRFAKKMSMKEHDLVIELSVVYISSITDQLL